MTSSDLPDSMILTVGSREARVRLLKDAAPITCRGIASLLPLDSTAVHAKFAGSELFFMVPLLLPKENQISAVGPGAVGYYPSRQTICLFYGDIVPFGQVNVFGQVEDGLEEMARAGVELLNARQLPVRCWLPSGVEVPVGDLPVAAGPIGELSQQLRASTRAGWLEAPADLARLHALRLPPTGKAAARLYANFDLFWTGETLQVLIDSLTSERFSARESALFASAMAARFADRLAHWRMDDVVMTLKRVSETLRAEHTPSSEAMQILLADLLVYVDSVQTWVDRNIPWAELDQAL